MKLTLTLSNYDTVVASPPDSRGLRVLESTYAWLRPREGTAVFIQERCLQGGPIYTVEYKLDTDGTVKEAVGDSRSGKSIIRHKECKD